MKINVPNRLSIARLVFAVIIIILVTVSYYGEFRGDYHWSLQVGNYELSYLMLASGILFIVASITDFFDGYLARKNHQITTLGKFLDPIADKILVNSVLIMFAVYNILPVWMTVILILRDTLVDFLRMVLASRQITLSAGIYGKLKTLFQMIGLTLLFFISHLNFSEQETILANEYGWLNQVIMIPMYLATVFSIFSGVVYFKKGSKYIIKKSDEQHGKI